MMGYNYENESLDLFSLSVLYPSPNSLSLLLKGILFTVVVVDVNSNIILNVESLVYNLSSIHTVFCSGSIDH